MADHGLNHCKSEEISSQERQNEVLFEEDFEDNKGDQQSSLEFEIVELYGQNSTLGKDCDDDADKDLTGKESKLHASELVLQPHDENCSSEPSDLQCPQCNKECSSAKALSRHIECCHQPTTCDICGLSFASGNQATYHKVRSLTL